MRTHLIHSNDTTQDLCQPQVCWYLAANCMTHHTELQEHCLDTLTGTGPSMCKPARACKPWNAKGFVLPQPHHTWAWLWQKDPLASNGLHTVKSICRLAVHTPREPVHVQVDKHLLDNNMFRLHTAAVSQLAAQHNMRGHKAVQSQAWKHYCCLKATSATCILHCAAWYNLWGNSIWDETKTNLLPLLCLRAPAR